VEPHKPGTARFEDVPETDVSEGSVLVEAVAVGICGTDVEIVEGKYGRFRAAGRVCQGRSERVTASTSDTESLQEYLKTACGSPWTNAPYTLARVPCIVSSALRDCCLEDRR